VTLKLTDDEVVALAASAGCRWPVPLPTVEGDDSAALGQAVVRGARSLRIRGLVIESIQGASLSRELDAVVKIAQVPAGFVAHVVRTSPRVAQAGGAVLITALTVEQALVDLISRAGVHDFDSVSPAEAGSLALDYLHAAFDSGPPGATDAGDVEVRSSLGSTAVTVVRGAVRIGDGHPIRSWADAEASLKPLFAASSLAVG